MRPAIEILAEVMDAYFREDRVENGEAAAAVIEADRAEVRLAEREAAVKWLRDRKEMTDRHIDYIETSQAADCIEAGEHRK